MTRPPLDPRTILIAATIARAQSMPGATLRAIFPQAVDIATGADPMRFRHRADLTPDQIDAKTATARRTAWLALAAANAARKTPRQPLRLVGGTPEGAA